MLTTLPNATVLQQAHYYRIGNDLQIKTTEETIVIQDYFIQPVPLITEEGKQITVADVIAQLNSDAGEEIIGQVVAIVNGPVSAESSAGQIRLLHDHDPVYLNDTLLTAPQSYIKIALSDNSIFQLGPLSKVQLTQYSYDPQLPEQGGKFVGDIFVGIFRFISGQISNDKGEQHTTFNTPSATIGIRGSEIDVRVDDEGATTILHSAGLVDVSARYTNTELSMYESGTLVYIPITPTLPSIQLATPAQVTQIRGQFTPLDTHIPQEILPHQTMPDASPVGPHDEGGRIYPYQFNESNAKVQLWQPSDYRDINSMHWDQQIEGEMPHLTDKQMPSDDSINMPQELPPFQISIPSEFVISEDNAIIINIPFFDNLQIDISQPTHGHVVNNWDGSLTYTPQFGYIGEDYFELHSVEKLTAFQAIVSQPTYARATQDQSFSVLGIAEQDEDIVYTINQQDHNTYQVVVTIKAQLIDFPALGPNAEYTQPLYGQLQVLAEGQLRYLPPENFHGTDSFTYRVSPDAQFMTVEFQVEPVNDPPISLDDTGITLVEDTVLALTPDQLLANDSDADHDSLSIISVNSLSTVDATGNSVDLTHGYIAWNEDKQQVEFMPTLNYFGSAQFAYTVVDTHGARSVATVTMEITPVNDAPVTEDDHLIIQAPVDISVDTLLANDSDVDSEFLQLIRVDNAQNGVVTMNHDETIHFVPNEHFIQGSFDYFVTDNVIDEKTGQLTEVRGTVSITTPFANGLIQAHDDQLIVTSNPFIITADQLLSNDSGSRLQIVSVDNSVNGEVTLQEDGNILFIPQPSFAEQGGQFNYTISSDENNLSHASVILTGILPTMTAQGDTIVIGNKQSITVATSTLISNDFSEQGDSLIVTAVSAGQNGTVVLEGDYVTFTRDEHFIELGDFFYTVSDGNSRDTAQVIVTGSEILHQAPVTQDDAIALFNHSPQTISITQLLSNDENPEALKLTGVQDAYQGEVVINGDVIVFTPSTQLNCAENNEARFTYSVTNEYGLSATAQVILTAYPMPPLVQPDEIIVNDNAQFTINAHDLLSNDTDPYQQNLTLVAVSDAIGGGVDLQSDQSIIFTPNDEFITTRLGGFSYTVSNGCDTATTMVTVRNENIPPIAQDDTIVVHSVDATEIDKMLLLDNDSDSNGDPLQISAVFDPVSGTVQLLDTGNILFIPTTEFVDTGIGGFMVTIADNHGGMSTAMVSLTPDNRPPIATSDTFDVTTNAPITIAPEELLANDTDPDGDPLTIIEVNESIAGTTELLTDGRIQFTPTDDFIITQMGGFTYTITDGQHHTNTAFVSLNYENLPPNAVDDHFEIVTDAATLITTESLLSNDTDPQQESLQLIEVSQAINGWVELLDAHSIQFTPSDAFATVGTGSFSYTITDKIDNQSTATVTLTAINNPPVAMDDQLTLADTAPINLNIKDLLANDTDFEQDTLSVINANHAMNGEVILNTDQTITFTPNDTFAQVGIASFVYVIADEAGGEAMATVNLILDEPQVLFAVNDVVTVSNADTATVIPSMQLLANDIGNELEIISFSRNVLNGSVSLTPEGDILFTPKTQFAIDRVGAFSYVMTDGEQTSIGLVDLRIGTNIAPDGKEDTIAMTPEALSVAITHDSLLSNDFDIDGDSLSIIATKAAENGFITTLNDETIFLPDAQFSTTGQGSFQYIVADGKGGMDIVTVNIIQDSLTNGRSGRGLDTLLDDSFLNIEFTGDLHSPVQTNEQILQNSQPHLNLADVLELPDKEAFIIETSDSPVQNWDRFTDSTQTLYHYNSEIDLLMSPEPQNQLIL